MIKRMDHPFIQFARAIPRPFIAILFALIWAIAEIEEIGLSVEFRVLAGACITWYFGERAYRHSKDKNGGTNATV